MFNQIQYSDKGTNDRAKEETAFMYFTDYLDECEKGGCVKCFLLCVKMSCFPVIKNCTVTNYEDVSDTDQNLGIIFILSFCSI